MLYQVLKLGIGSLLLILPLSANAGKYWAVGFGNSSFDLEVNLPGFSPIELEDTPTVGFTWGTRHENLGLEAELNLPSYEWENTGGRITHDIFSLAFYGIGYKPISSSVDLYGKFGINFWSTDITADDININGDDGTDITYGFGLDVAISDKWNFRAEYDFFPGVGDGIDEGDISQLMFKAVKFYK